MAKFRVLLRETIERDVQFEATDEQTVWDTEPTNISTEGTRLEGEFIVEVETKRVEAMEEEES